MCWQGEKTLEACRNGKNWTVLFGVLMSSVFWLMVASISMHAVATATAFAFPQLLLQITNYLSTCDVRAGFGLLLFAACLLDALQS